MIISAATSTKCDHECNMTTKVFTIVIILLATLLIPVSGSGLFEFRFDSFDNPLGRDQEGTCCSDRSSLTTSHSSTSSAASFLRDISGGDSASCSHPCRIFFRVCLKHYQNNIDTDTPCTFGEVTTPVLGNNGIQASGYIVPIHFNFSWPKTCSYIVDVGHESFEGSRTQPGRNRLIYQLKIQTTLNVTSKWTEKSYELGGRSKARLKFAIRVTCSDNHYGDSCSVYCRSRDDNYGHYLCSETGQLVCLPGWQGTEHYCKTPQCLPGCHKEHGYCDEPNQCLCRSGWQGPNCDECIKYPGCLHGTCSQPFKCDCKDGWGGILCNQDLNYCTNHRPCKNGGTCSNSGHGSYDCKCPPNFTGRNCEIELNACDQEPCQNAGTCRTDPEKGNYTCDCPLGYTGRNCESLASLCSTNPCVNGGTCIMGPSGPLCICPPGDFDENNNCRKYTGCHQMPCKNGGKCTQTEVGYTCSCQSGFSGNNCEMNQDDCAGVICQNGGSCIDGIKDFYCRCPPGYSGKWCQNRVDLCRGMPCANGGTCIDSGGIDFNCSCAPGFTGKHCSVNIDDCASNPCLNGGHCQDRVNEFICRCDNGYTGSLCQYPPNHMPSPPSMAATLSSSSSFNDSLSTAKMVHSKDDIVYTSNEAIALPGIQFNYGESTSVSIMISIIIATLLAFLLIILIIWIFLKNQKCRLEKERHRDEELARSHNEANSRSLMNCLDGHDDQRSFKANMIRNQFKEESAASFGANYQLNRQKSLTLSKLSNSEFESNLRLAAASGKHLVSGGVGCSVSGINGGAKTPNLMRTKSSNKLLNTELQVENTAAGTLKTSKSTSKLNCLLDITEGEKKKALLPDVTAHSALKAQDEQKVLFKGEDHLQQGASLALRHHQHNNQHNSLHRHSVMLPPHSPWPPYQISNSSLYRSSDHSIRPPPHPPAHPHHHLPGHHSHHSHHSPHAHHHHHHGHGHRHPPLHLASPHRSSATDEHTYAELSINKSAVINC